MNIAETAKDSEIDSDNQCCKHIYHVYHIDHVEHIHHVYPPAVSPIKGKPETLKSPVGRTVLEAVSSFGSVEGLSALLPIVNNSITITSGTLPGGVIGDVLHAFNTGNPMEIVKVVKSVKADGVSVVGTTSFMGENNVAISAAFQPNGDYTFKVDFPSSSLRKFLEPSPLELPKDFDVSLPETWAIISRKDEVLNIVAAAKGSLGEVSIQGTKEEMGWEFTAGIDLAASNLSRVYKPLAAFDDFVGLTDIVMILSSRAAPDFDFPDTDQFGVPALSWGKIKLPDDAGGLIKGLNFFANLSTAKSKAFRLLANFLRIKLDGSVNIELSVSLPDPEQSSKLFISFTENDVVKGLSKITGTVGGVLKDGEVGAELTATANASIQGQPVVFEVDAVAVETGVFITGDMISTGQPIMFTIDGIHFSIADIGLLIGIDDAPVPIPSLGFSATIDVGHVQASASLFLNSIIPEQSMFAAAISSLSLFDVASSIAGQKNIPSALANVLKRIGLEQLHSFPVDKMLAKQLITALDNRDLPTIAGIFSQNGISIPSTSDQLLLDINIKSSLWYLTDLTDQMLHYELNASADGSVIVSVEPQFYCCPQPTTVGSFTFSQGFHVYAKIDYVFIAASVQIEAQGNNGISADVTLDKIIIGHSQFLSITDAAGDTGPQFSLATFTQGSQAPHISISGAMKVLGLSLPSIYLDITEDGVNFDITYPASNPYFTLNGTIGDTNNMHLDGEIDVSVNTTLDLGELGKVPFDAVVNGSLDLEVNKGNPNVSVDAEFELKGCGKLQTGKIDLDFKTDTLDNLPKLAKTLVPYIEKTVVNELKSDASKWADMIKDGAIQGIKGGADQIAGVLNSEYKLSASDASKILSRSGCAVDDISNALKSEYKLSSELTAATLNQALGVSEQEANKVAGVVNSVDHTIDHGVDHVADKIGSAFKHIKPPHFRLETEIAPTPSEPQAAPALAAEPSARPAADHPTLRNTNPLKVPYCDQQLRVVNGQHWRKGFSGSSAMLAMYWGKEPNENVYEKLRARYGDSTNSDAQLGALRSLGLTANFETDGTVAMLKQEIDAGRPVAVGWLCDGPVSAPSGGGHWIVIIGYDDTGFLVNDPYGNCDLVNGGYLSHDDGAGLHYSYQNWVPRWRVDGTGGWMLTCRS